MIKTVSYSIITGHMTKQHAVLLISDYAPFSLEEMISIMEPYFIHQLPTLTCNSLKVNILTNIFIVSLLLCSSLLNMT